MTAPPVPRPAVQLGVAALAAAALLAGAWGSTHSRIEDADREARRDALALVVPGALFDNDPDRDAIRVQAPAWTGVGQTIVRRARRDGAPVALVFDVVAPDGYAGPIRLLVAVDVDDRVLGVRIAAHYETPGLGDAIDAGRSDWIDRFRGRGLGDPPAGQWRVRRDGGDFDQFAGATVTPRAVVAAVARTLAFSARHGEAMRVAEAGATLRFDDAPDPLPPPATREEER